ncbi:YjdJ family protein [Bacillus sp. CECT 9360]|uniref:YjdJ family protein n=1 Tax=Bacillus sp. CECT 9360 TaxID=2845821 RepID=UPI001E512F32|nr:YjdJ family protein [Bacillus sp. CECT 9360]
MSYKWLLQASLAFTILLFSTGASWYEGSGILDDPWEWGYSTPITQLLNVELNHANDISQFDYFVYAAKFHPFFPVMMFISGIYLFILLGYRLLQKNHKRFSYFVFGIGALLLFLCNIVSNSPSIGANTFFKIMLSGGIGLISFAFIFYFQVFKTKWLKYVS